MAPRRPPSFVQPPVKPTRSFCPKSEEGLHTYSEDRTHCVTCNFYFVAVEVDGENPERVAERTAKLLENIASQPRTLTVRVAPLPAAVAIPPADVPVAADVPKARQVPRVGRKPGSVNVYRFPRSVVAELLGLSPESLRTTMARVKAGRFTPDVEGLRRFVAFVYERMPAGTKGE